MSKSSLSTLFRAVAPEKKPGDVTISYSQFSMWATCPLKWKLNYVDRYRLGGPSINTCFGTSFHETLQWYLHTMYTKSVKEADQLDLQSCLLEQMQTNYVLDVERNNNEHFSNKHELAEFYNDGVAILDWLKKRRGDYFRASGYELIGIELPLYIQASKANERVKMNGFIDIVIRDTVNDKIIIIDIKTSTGGWNKYQKNDKLKASQLVLYKSYFAEQYGYDVEKIDIQYFIVKRKLIEDFAYPQKRVQLFEPASGKPTRKKLHMEIDTFVSTCFNADGSYNKETNYLAIAGKNAKNCKYCEYSEREDLCPKANRIK
jgi:hypothetical protein